MDDDNIESVYGAGKRTFLGAEDLHGEDLEVIIKNWRKREMEQNDWDNPGVKYKAIKVILSFEGMDGEVILNKTNSDAIKAAYGTGMNSWIGKPIILFQGEWAGKPALRIRVPKVVKRVAAKPSRESENPADALDDKIPF